VAEWTRSSRHYALSRSASLFMPRIYTGFCLIGGQHQSHATYGCATPTPPLLKSGVGPLFAPTKPRLLTSSYCLTATSTIRTLLPLQPTMPKLRVVINHDDGIHESLTITCDSPPSTRNFPRARSRTPCLTSQLGAFPTRRSLMMINTKMAPRGCSDPLDLNGFSRATDIYS
jgi:hypothetical protein